MLEIEQKIFNREPDRESEGKMHNGKLKVPLWKEVPIPFHFRIPHQEAIFLFLFSFSVRQSNIWNHFNARAKLVIKRMYSWTSCTLLMLMISILNSPTSTNQSCPLHFSVYKQKEFHVANKHLLPSAEKQR